MHVEPTPGDRSVEDLVRRFPQLGAARMVKTILYTAVVDRAEVDVAVLMRGDQDVNRAIGVGATLALRLAAIRWKVSLPLFPK